MQECKKKKSKYVSIKYDEILNFETCKRSELCELYDEAL